MKGLKVNGVDVSKFPEGTRENLLEGIRVKSREIQHRASDSNLSYEQLREVSDKMGVILVGLRNEKSVRTEKLLEH